MGGQALKGPAQSVKVPRLRKDSSCRPLRTPCFEPPCFERTVLNELLERTIDQGIASEAVGGSLAVADSTNGMVFLLIAALGVLMAIVYIPIRLFLTITARSRRLKLLQKIRRLREDISRSLNTD